MTYREKAVAITRIAGQELVERAEELIPNTTGVKDIDIWIRIPSNNLDEFDVPEIQVHTNVYPKRENLQKIFDIMSERENPE